MKVINVAGFPVKFEKEGRTYSVPNDNQLHIIPDKCYFEDNFQGLLRVIVPPTEVHQVTRKMNNKTRRVDINDPTIKEIVLDTIEEKKKKPLAGKRLKPAIRKKLRKTNKKKTEDDE